MASDEADHSKDKPAKFTDQWSKLFQSQSKIEEYDYPYSDISKLNSYLAAGRVSDIKAAIDGKCSFQTIKNLLSDGKDVENSTIVKNNILREITKNLPTLSVETEYKAYLAIISGTGSKQCAPDLIDGLIGRYSIELREGQKKLGSNVLESLSIVKNENPLFPIFFLRIKKSGKTIKHDGFIIDCGIQILLLGSSKGFITIITLNRDGLSDDINTMTVNGKISIFDMNVGAHSYSKISLIRRRKSFPQRD